MVFHARFWRSDLTASSGANDPVSSVERSGVEDLVGLRDFGTDPFALLVILLLPFIIAPFALTATEGH